MRETREGCTCGSEHAASAWFGRAHTAWCGAATPAHPVEDETVMTIAALAERLLLDLEVSHCDCGAPYRESDAYDLAVALVRAVKQEAGR